MPEETRNHAPAEPPRLRVGIDAVSIEKTRNLMARYGRRFTDRVFTPAEQELCENKPRPAESFAARFAAKEAVMKVLSAGPGSGVRMKQIEVLKGPGPAPRVALHAAARDRAEALGFSELCVSLSHEAGLAIAVAVALSRGEESSDPSRENLSPRKKPGTLFRSESHEPD